MCHINARPRIKFPRAITATNRSPAEQILISICRIRVLYNVEINITMMNS